MAHLTLVVGGVRSGKSRFAEQLAQAHPPVTYLATARAGDAEMARRIARHRQRRAADWRTVEESWDLPAAVAGLVAGPGCVLVECLTLWLTNLLVGLPERAACTEAEALAEVDALVAGLRQGSGRLVVVSNEVGWGIIPANELARRFGDLLGEANQRLAAAATEVYACVAGIPVRIK